MKCPVDDTTLAITDRQGIEIDYCPECRGVWLDRGELDKLIERENRWVEDRIAESKGSHDDKREARDGRPAQEEEKDELAPVRPHGVRPAVGLTSSSVVITKPVVVLFDVDETLVHTGGAGARSWNAAFQKVYDLPADIGKHTSAGETDPQVARETFRGVLGRDPVGDELDPIYAQYLLALSTDIWSSKEYRMLPGADPVLQRCVDAGVILGIVSGAMEGAAREPS